MVIIDKSIIELLQYRIQQEEISSRMYEAMSRWLDFKGFTGAAKLWKKYSTEELTHAGWATVYLQDLNILPETRVIEQPQMTFKSLPNIVALSMKHEVEILEQCSELMNKCQEIGDNLTFTLAHKFVAEQSEEIGKLQLWIDQLEQFGDTGASLMMIDEKMGAYAG